MEKWSNLIFFQMRWFNHHLVSFGAGWLDDPSGPACHTWPVGANSQCTRGTKGRQKLSTKGAGEEKLRFFLPFEILLMEVKIGRIGSLSHCLQSLFPTCLNHQRVGRKCATKIWGGFFSSFPLENRWKFVLFCGLKSWPTCGSTNLSDVDDGRWDFQFRQLFDLKERVYCFLMKSIIELGGGFKYCLFFTLTWENDSVWLIFFRWVETTNLRRLKVEANDGWLQLFLINPMWSCWMRHFIPTQCRLSRGHSLC